MVSRARTRIAAPSIDRPRRAPTPAPPVDYAEIYADVVLLTRVLRLLLDRRLLSASDRARLRRLAHGVTVGQLVGFLSPRRPAS